MVAAADTIRIVEDLGNNIPDRSWMLYLLELFDSRVPVELNLICQFNDRDNFWAIFGGVNRYKFTKVLPIVGHSYLRQILMQRETGSIEYSASDLDSGASETFRFEVPAAMISFQGSNHFTGLEWWNKAGSSPFPIRYKVEVSNLKYGRLLDSSKENLAFDPFNAFVSNLDGHARGYPVTFADVGIKDGCICYTLAPGSCSTGLSFLAY
jgi:hypothetical protein